MSVYHLQDGKLVKLCEEVIDLFDDTLERGDLLEQAGWEEVDQIEGAYTLYAPRKPSRSNNALRSFAYFFRIEDANYEFPWVLLVRDDLGEYLEAMRLMQPLLSRALFLEQEAYHFGKREQEERQARS